MTQSTSMLSGLKWSRKPSSTDLSHSKTCTPFTQEHDYSQTQVAHFQVPCIFLDPFTLIWESPTEVLWHGLTTKHKTFSFRKYTADLSSSKHHVSQRPMTSTKKLSAVPRATKQFWSRVECLRPIINMKIKRMFSLYSYNFKILLTFDNFHLGSFLVKGNW